MVTRTLAALAAVAILAGGSAYAECDATALIEQCKARLSEGSQIASTYTLAGKDGGAVAMADDHVLMSSKTYQLAVCGAEDVGFTLETGARKPVMTNGEAGARETLVAIKPERSSVYYLVFSAPEGTCAGAVLGMKR
ncbi:MAG: hypothetical protein KDC18_15620 [Alphaproteobacteria bacterium]|nr:hypothetical protein [Alphaproteobacteria bacterium]MCB9930810.1 hypothetical protein [Alphaproteobacteria bacterium]